MATCGLDRAMMVVKTEQEPASKEVEEELARAQRESGAAGTITEHSQGGDSATSGRTGRAIQEVGGFI